MSNFKRFNTSNSNDYNTQDVYQDGTLTWNNNQGLRLHDGETPGGDPIIGIHNWTNPIATAVGNNGSATIVFAGDETNNGDFNLGQRFYITGDLNETHHTVTSREYTTGSNVTFVGVTPSFNVLPQEGTIVYQTILKDNINQIQAGDGIRLVNEGRKLLVEKAYSGQEQYLLTATTLADGITLSQINNSLITVTRDPAYTTFTPGESHNMTLPAATDLIALGTKITVINSSECVVNVAGWPGPGFDMASYASLELVYHYNAIDDAKMWWATSYFVWD